jgi:RHS repeat-associated protein
MNDGTGTTTYSYNSLDQLTSQTNGAGATARYGYDNSGHVTALTYPNGKTVTKTYDGAGQVTRITDWLGKSFTFRYDHDGNEIIQANPNGITAAYRYDHNDQVVAITDWTRAGAMAKFFYRRNGLSQVTGSITARASRGLPQRYSYDALSQVTSDATGRYSYDSADNLTALPGGITQTFDAAGELTTSSWPAGRRTFPVQGRTGTSVPHRGGGSMARHGRITYSYDTSGNRTGIAPGTGKSTTLTYDQANRLTGYGTSASYAYDGDGLRMSKTVNGTKTAFAWDETGSLPLMLIDGSDSYIYGPYGLPLEKITGTTPAYILHDQQGSTRLLTNARGALVATYAYSTYGKTIQHTGQASTPLQFDAQYTDAESGFQYLRARYYDPSSGVFLTVDPLAELTASPYSFAFNQPVNFSDPDGRCIVLCTVVGAVTGAVVGGVVSVATYAIMNQGNITARGLAASATGGVVGGAITGACDGTTLMIAAIGCGAVGGALGEATTEFIGGNSLDPYDIAVAFVTGGAFGPLPDWATGILNGVINELLNPAIAC